VNLQAVHTAPVSSMAFDSTSTLLATGGADATVKVWDVVRQYCTNNMRQHSGVVRYLQHFFSLLLNLLLLFLVLCKLTNLFLIAPLIFVCICFESVNYLLTC